MQYQTNSASTAKGTQYLTFKGTAREFIAAEVKVNGKPINQPALSDGTVRGC